MKIVYFATPADLRQWFARHHHTATELWVGFHKKGSGKPSVTWPQSVDEALCVGWIDGIRKNVNATSYTIRFTPRRPSSTWSAINIRRAEELSAAGRMKSAGRRAFAARRENRSGIYSYEQRREAFDEPYASRLKQNRAASRFFAAQPPSYRRAACWWVVSAKREDTRLKRLAMLIDLSAHGQRIPQFTRRAPQPRRAPRRRKPSG